MKHIVVGINGERELDIPDGYTVIEEGYIQSGDLFLAGGSHNFANGLIKKPLFMPFTEENFDQPIHRYSVTLRPI